MASKLNIKTDLVNCITKKRGLMLLEGKDDPKFYEGLILKYHEPSIDKVVLRKVEHYSEGSGCTKIIDMIYDNQEFLEDNKYNFMCIIDGDARNYKNNSDKFNKIKDKDYVFVLKLYSFESYCYDKKALSYIVSKNTSATRKNLDSGVLDYIYKYVTDKIYGNLYYISLECLYNHKNEVRGLFTYGDDASIAEAPKRNGMLKQIDKQKLDDFAKKLNIKLDINEIKAICKGKHFLLFCSSEISYVLDVINKNKMCNLNERKNIENRLLKETGLLICEEEYACSKECCVFKTDIIGYSPTDKRFPQLIYSDLRNSFQSDELSQIFERIEKFILNLN